MADEDYFEAGGDFDDIEDVEDDINEIEEEDDDAVHFNLNKTVSKEQKTLQWLFSHHPETKLLYVEQIMEKLPLASYPPENDANHKSQISLTLYEKTKMIGFRANQIANGAKPFINVPPHVTDVATIARMELEQKRLPFIIARTMPDGSFEYWRLQDLIVH